MAIAPFPTLARAATQIRSELWIALRDPIDGVLRSTPIDGTNVIDARDAIAHPAGLLDAWLAIGPALGPSDLQVGLQLYVDGVLWTGGEHGRFGPLGGWAQLALGLLDGRAGSASIGDERAIRARIDGAHAMIWEEHALRLAARDAWWPIRCERVAMARAIAEGGALVLALRARVIEELARRTERASAVIHSEIARDLDVLSLRELATRLAPR